MDTLRERVKQTFDRRFPRHIARCREDHSGRYVVAAQGDESVRVWWREDPAISALPWVTTHRLEVCAGLLLMHGFAVRAEQDIAGSYLRVTEGRSGD